MSYQPRHVYDAIPSIRDPRDFRMMVVNAATLPEESYLPAIPILDQGQEGSCVGHGCAGARETLEIIGGNAPPVVPLSRAFIYYQARLREGTPTEDSGAQVRDGCWVMQTIGVCTEDLFPYKVGDFAKVPPDIDLVSAVQWKIDTYARLSSSLEVRAAIAANMPVPIGVAVFQSFETQIGPDGRVPMPGANGSDPELGGHCMFISGYKPDPQAMGTYLFRVQNSWGPNWADHGYCWMPQAYLDNPNVTFDMWSIAASPQPRPFPEPAPQPHRRRRWHFVPF